MKVIHTYYRGATNHTGARYVAEDLRGDSRVSIPVDHSLSDEQMHLAAARKLCEKFNMGGLKQISTHAEKGMLHVVLEEWDLEDAGLKSVAD